MSNSNSLAEKTPHCRHGETDEKCHYRSRRFFLANGEWYFDTREHTHVGPFGSESSAARGLSLYLQEISKENASIAVALARANNGHWSITNYQ